MIELRKSGVWEELNQNIKKELGTTANVKLYQSVAHALLESVMGFQLLYSHKKQFYTSLGLGNHAEESLLFLAKQGSKAIELLSVAEPALDEKKSLFVIQDMDDAITGEILNLPTSPTTEKVFHIRIAHSASAIQKLGLNPQETEVFIFKRNDSCAIALLGRRAQNLTSLMAPTLAWSLPTRTMLSRAVMDANWVQRVESEKWGGGQALPALSPDRYFDRAILHWLDLDASALRDLLIAKGINENQIEVLSLQRWGDTKLITQFQKRGWSPEVFRGTLILSTELREVTTFKSHLQDCVDQLRKMSSF